MESNYSDRILKSAERVFDVMERRVTPEEFQRIKDAFFFAAEAHKNQNRNSGEPYITHPIAVATIAAEELELDANTVCAAFLHDVVEDTSYDIEDIRSRFGDDVAFLVDVVTKRKKEKYKNSKQVDNYKQILDSVHYDVRALLVKLSDRLHNMRTLDSMKPNKQMKIAGETDFFYAPLAGRLGLFHVKSELENLSFRFRCPREYQMLEKALLEDKQRTFPEVIRFTEEINRLMIDKGIVGRTEIRYRRPYSVWKDMKEASCDFSHVPFKHYIRVIYQPMTEWAHQNRVEKDTALFIYSILSEVFKERPGSMFNYIDNPKENGYQSFHVKFLNHNGAWEELHIGSERMHINAKLGCVVERGESWIERFRQVLQNIADNTDGFFMDEIGSSLYNEDIIVFTPKGKGIILPKGATVLDFAFEVHTKIGAHAHYARINGKLCPISTELHRGDCVEVGTNPAVLARPQWFTYAHTVKTKRCLREILTAQDALQYVRCEHCRPLPGDEVVGFTNGNGSITIHRRNCSEAIRRASENGDDIVSVNFEQHPLTTFPARIHLTAIDRYLLLSDIINCFVRQGISMEKLNIETNEQIADCDVIFSVHSADELSRTIEAISRISGIDEVQRLDF